MSFQMMLGLLSREQYGSKANVYVDSAMKANDYNFPGAPVIPQEARCAAFVDGMSAVR